MLSANPKFACTGERIIQKTPLIWAGGNSTRLFTNPLTASPLAFTASLTRQKHSRTKSRQLRRLPRVEIRKSPICSQVQLIPNCFEKEDRFPFNNTATVNTSFWLMSFCYRGLLEWSNGAIKYVSFVTLIFSTIFAKVLFTIIFFFRKRNDIDEPFPSL